LNSYGNPASVEGLASSVVMRTDTYYDALGRVTKQVMPGTAVGATATVLQTLDRWGNVISATDARGYVTDYRFHHASRLIEEKKPTVNIWLANGTNSPGRPVTRNYYDKMGRGLGTVDANGNASTARYDAAGQFIAEYHSDGGVIQYQYDAFGRRVRTID